MLATADTFMQMTRQVMALADALSRGKLVMVYEGGYPETYTLRGTTCCKNVRQPDQRP
jgi:acetoin utilization deacetylase AcuC-like enzyme